MELIAGRMSGEEGQSKSERGESCKRPLPQGFSSLPIKPPPTSSPPSLLPPNSRLSSAHSTRNNGSV